MAGFNGVGLAESIHLGSRNPHHDATPKISTRPGTMRTRSNPNTLSTPATRGVIRRHDPKFTKLPLLIDMDGGEFHSLHEDKYFLPVVLGRGRLDFLGGNMLLGP